MKKKLALQKASLFLLASQGAVVLSCFLGMMCLSVPFLAWIGLVFWAVWLYFSKYLAFPVGIVSLILEIICMIRNKHLGRFPLLLAHPVIGYFAWRWFQALMSV